MPTTISERAAPTPPARMIAIRMNPQVEKAIATAVEELIGTGLNVRSTA